MSLFPQRNRGFTLIELLVVIAIIGILAGVIFISLSGAKASARDARRESDIRQIVSAQGLYYNNNSAYLITRAIPLSIGTFLTTVPIDPGPGSPSYGWVDNVEAFQDYCVYATLEKASPTGGNKLIFTGGPGGSRQRDVATTFIPTLADCE
ncbi:MAG: type II secretion system protein [bacterium]|nr:type II secretion system protein [bacterium]